MRSLIIMALAIGLGVGCTATEERLVYVATSSNGLVGCDTDAGMGDGSSPDADSSVTDTGTDAPADVFEAATDTGPETGTDAGTDGSTIPECTQLPGAWANVTPASASLNPNTPTPANVDPGGNYGVQDVLVDPVNPNILYAFLCHQGVWKSVDYGCTWAQIPPTGTNATHLITGRPWTAAIDPSLTRNPTTPPTLYTVSGYGDLMGAYVSTNGGVDWTIYPVGNTTSRFGDADDAYAFDIDPTNSLHLITGMHDLGISESMDGAHTWRTVSGTGSEASFGISVYPFFVRGATPATWITQAEWEGDTAGMWRTTNSGATWTHVLPKLEHDHGSAQIYQDGLGTVWASGELGPAGNPIERSIDFGQTWHAVTDGSIIQNGVFGTANWVYATRPYADNGGIGQHLQKASLTSGGVTWVDWTPTAPMSNGAKRAATTTDGRHSIIVSGNWNAGIWRYVEPLNDGG